ncbi:MAG: hypothetical protein HOL04_04210 [Gammaproteobacteria bacterium]|jgi:threonine/homoserine/homoserine lactone efflux protein|nr:hypothetical protein [Gammaproteobacteria bacterium]MBT4608234.1 hypothetical protein [Thiotrichales bacterium]MBT3471269.1 hypothetical protein [Gammaproteobacteria bacterium]MBT3966064.1 hypothetical protein [Gammaproteobacteria bacterium]MBT4330965.1 hypothetical protein [Gammaproteobacteria bacterium]
MFNIQHDLDAMIIALLGVVSLIWLGRNIFMAFKELIKDQSENSYSGHRAG